MKKQQTAKAGSALLVLVVGIIAFYLKQQGGAPQPGPAGPVTSVPGVSPRTQAASPRAPAERQSAAADTLRIASWNIEWLGKPEERSGREEGVAQKPEDIARYIIDSRASILALQEIVADSGGARPRCSALDRALAALESASGRRWHYVLFPGRSEGDQLTGVAWDPAAATPIDSAGGDWDATDSPWRLPIATSRGASGAGLWNRPPHAMKFSLGPGRTDVVLVVVHMKADFQGDFADHRGREAEALVTALDALRRTFNDQDIIILGDTNVTSPGEPAPRAIQAAGFADLNQAGSATHWRGGATDRVFVPTDQPEFESTGFEVMSDEFLASRRWRPSDFKRSLSDHYMVVATVAVRVDDD